VKLSGNDRLARRRRSARCAQDPHILERIVAVYQKAGILGDIRLESLSELGREPGLEGREETLARQQEEMRTDLEAAVCKIFMEHGPAAFEITERATALHEAGHAVIAMSLAGLVPVSMTIGLCSAEHPMLGTRIRAGETLLEPGSAFNRILDVRIEKPQDVIENAAFHLAGQAAEALCDWKDYRWGSSLDEQYEAEAILNGVAHHRLGLPKRQWCALILITRIALFGILGSNRTVLERVAAALISSRKLERPELERLLADVPRANPPLGEWVLAETPAFIRQVPDGDLESMLDDFESKMRGKLRSARAGER
jgi:hypothetical protein